MLLVGGTSHVGKSTVAAVLAERLGFECRSTDYLARHPGRPWRTPERDVPPHVAEHYASLTVDELIGSVLAHYERLWPRIEDLVAAGSSGPGPGLVLEGSALWPTRVADLSMAGVAAAWLTADETVLRARIRLAGAYDRAPAPERRLVDAFLARSVRFQSLVVSEVDRLGLTRIDADHLSATDLADAVLRVTG